MVEPRGGDVPHLKKENPTPDPYEFNAKVEDGFGIPIKKIKVEKVEAACSPMQPEVHDIGIDTCSVGVITEPECLGPCEPGTSVTLEGIVWHETENAGVLVINVTWRGKTYVGTLLDATKHDWAPPRFNCDSPVSDLESRTPKGRGKRGRGNTATPVNERVNSNNSNNSNSSNANNSNNNSNNEGRKLRKGRRCGGNSFQAPPSPAKPEHDRSSSLKRKGRPSDLDLSVPPDSSKGSKRCRSSSRGATAASNTTNNQNSNTSSTGSIGTTVTIVSSNGSTPGESTSPGLLTCPEANCNKQYKHINGLRYHQSHAHHSAMLQAQEAEENLRDDNAASMEENATDEEIARVRKDEPTEMSAGKASRKDKIKEESMSDDNIAADCSLSTEQQSDTGLCPPSSTDDSDAQKCAPEKLPAIKIEPSVEGLKTEKVTIKTEHPSSCSGPIPPSAPGHTVSSVSKQSLTTQIYQLAAAPMGCLGSGSVAMVTQTNCQINPLTTVTTSSASSPVSSQSLPIPVSAMGPISHVSESDKGIKTDKSSVLDKSKVKTPTRPIVPAPTPQVVAFAGGVGSNHTSLTSVPSTHTQVSPSLKPIQPKPTILGEPMNINPALVGLKDKKAKQKKKCKEKDGIKPGELGPMKGDIPKYERTAVIKAVASPPKPGMELLQKKEGGSLMEPPHLTSDLSRPGAGTLGCGNSVIASSQVSPKSVDPSHMARMAQPPGLLKVGPSGLLSTPERKTPVNDDVQSPAYSDISDANESGSPSQGDTPVKGKEESSSSRKQEKHANQNPSDQAAAPVPHYSMYGYYGQSSYLMPNVSQASSPHVSQSCSSVSNSSSGTTVSNHKTPGSVKGDHSSSSNSSNATSAASSHDEKVSISIDEGSKMIEEKKIKEEKEDPKHKEGAPPGGGGGTGGPSGGASGPGLPPPDYPQKLYSPYYWHQHNTYQYPYGYMEPYSMHLVPPQYRPYDKVLEDQKRLQQHHQGKDVEPVKKPGDYHSKSGLPDESKGPPHSDLPPNMRSIKSNSHGIALKPTPADKMTDSHKLTSEKSLERDREQALREKQNENHQILKESIELKPQMDKSRYEMSSLEAYRIHDDMRHSEEIQRYYMFNQQKLIGQEKHKMDFASKADMQSMESMIPKSSSHKSLEHGRMLPEDIHVRDTSSSSTGSSGTGSSSHNPSKRDLSDNKSKEVVRDMNAVGKSMSSDMKGDEKQRMMMMDRMRSPADSQKLKGSYSSSLSASGNSGNSNNSGSNISSSPSTNSSSSSSNTTTTTATTTTTTVASASSANYPHYLSYPYVQSPAYNQLHFDPYRPFNPVLGYPNPPYLHPTHLAYRVNPNEPEKDEKNSNPSKTLLNQPVIGGSELETFKSAEVIHHSSSAPYFGVHKMHELQEKPLSSRPSPSSSSNCHSSPHTKSSISETSVSPSPNFEKSRDYQNSPPTQRHVHTHHHTHVVGTTFPLYPPFTNK